MSKKYKPSKTLSRYNQSLLNRIDNMDRDSEYNPYNARKKTTMTEDELFDNHEYLEEDEVQAEIEKSSKVSASSIIVPIVVIILLLETIGGLIFLFKSIA